MTGIKQYRILVRFEARPAENVIACHRTHEDGYQEDDYHIYEKAGERPDISSMTQGAFKSWVSACANVGWGLESLK